MESNDVQQRLRRVPAHLLAAQTEEAGCRGMHWWVAVDGGGLRLAEYSLVPKLRRVLVAGSLRGKNKGRREAARWVAGAKMSR